MTNTTPTIGVTRCSRLDDYVSSVEQAGARVRVLEVSESPRKLLGEIEVDDVGAVTARERPDVALVGLGGSSEHALVLIERIVHEATCPVIVLIDCWPTIPTVVTPT